MSTLNDNIEYIYATIPKNWIGICQNIYYIFSEYGLDAIKDCKVNCDKRTSHVIDCYNMFNSAVAALNSGREREANFIINYLKEQLKLYYPNMQFGDRKLYIGSGFTYEDVITEDNLIEGIQTLVGSYQIDVEAYHYMFFIFSSNMEYNRITFNGFDIPCDSVQIITIGGEEFKLIKSSNTYQAGSYIIKFE